MFDSAIGIRYKFGTACVIKIKIVDRAVREPTQGGVNECIPGIAAGLGTMINEWEMLDAVFRVEAIRNTLIL